MSDLDARLLAAHDRDDRAALVTLYHQAAMATHDENAAAFYLVHAYVFALETNHADCAALHEKLRALGREE